MQQAGIGLDVPHELGDEERITPRLARDGHGVGAGSLVLAAKEGQRQVLGVRGLQRPQGQHPTVDAGACPFVDLEECSQKRACRRIVATVTAQKEEPWRVGWTEEFREEERAVGVAPLQIVDRQDQRTAISQAGQELTQGAEGAAPQLLRVGDLGGEPWRRRHGPGPPQRREDPDQGSDVAGQERLRLQERQALHVLTQSIDDAVECLVGHRLLLVAPARQHNGLVAADQIVEEAPDQGGLADTRRAMDVEGYGPPPAHVRECDLQGLEISARPTKGAR